MPRVRTVPVVGNTAPAAQATLPQEQVSEWHPPMQLPEEAPKKRRRTVPVYEPPAPVEPKPGLIERGKQYASNVIEDVTQRSGPYGHSQSALGISRNPTIPQRTGPRADTFYGPEAKYAPPGARVKPEGYQGQELTNEAPVFSEPPLTGPGRFVASATTMAEDAPIMIPAAMAGSAVPFAGKILGPLAAFLAPELTRAYIRRDDPTYDASTNLSRAAMDAAGWIGGEALATRFLGGGSGAAGTGMLEAPASIAARESVAPLGRTAGLMAAQSLSQGELVDPETGLVDAILGFAPEVPKAIMRPSEPPLPNSTIREESWQSSGERPPGYEQPMMPPGLNIAERRAPNRPSDAELTPLDKARLRGSDPRIGVTTEVPSVKPLAPSAEQTPMQAAEQAYAGRTEPGLIPASASTRANVQRSGEAPRGEYQGAGRAPELTEPLPFDTATSSRQPNYYPRGRTRERVPVEMPQEESLTTGRNIANRANEPTRGAVIPRVPRQAAEQLRTQDTTSQLATDAIEAREAAYQAELEADVRKPVPNRPLSKGSLSRASADMAGTSEAGFLRQFTEERPPERPLEGGPVEIPEPRPQPGGRAIEPPRVAEPPLVAEPAPSVEQPLPTAPKRPPAMRKANIDFSDPNWRQRYKEQLLSENFTNAQAEEMVLQLEGKNARGSKRTKVASKKEPTASDDILNELEMIAEESGLKSEEVARRRAERQGKPADYTEAEIDAMLGEAAPPSKKDFITERMREGSTRKQAETLYKQFRAKQGEGGEAGAVLNPFSFLRKKPTRKLSKEDQSAFDEIDKQVRKPNFVRDVKSAIKNIPLLWREALPDKFAPIEDMVRFVAKRHGVEYEAIPPTENPVHVGLALEKSAGGQARMSVELGVPNTIGKIRGSALKEVLGPIWGDIDDFVRYAVAKNGLENYHKKGLDPGFSKAAAERVVAKLENPKFERTLKNITKWSDDVLQYVIDAGGLSKEAAETMRREHPIWIPFYRYFEGRESGPRSGRGYSDTPSAIHARKGGGQQILDPLTSFYMYARNMFELGNKLRFQQAIMKFSEKYDEPWFAKKVRTLEGKELQAEVKEMFKQAEEAGLDPTHREMLNMLIQRQGKGSEYTVRLWRNGKLEEWRLDPDVHRVMKQIDKRYLPTFWRVVVGKPTRAMRLGAAALSGEFQLRNTFRDPTTFSTYSRYSSTPYDAIRGVVEEFLGGDAALRHKMGGLDMSTIMGIDRAAARLHLNRIMADTSLQEAMHIVKSPREAMGVFIDVIREKAGMLEAGPRVTELKRSLEAGEAKYGKDSEDAWLQAVLDSKDVTINFTRAGYISEVLNQMFPFFNPRIQGASKFYRTFIGDPIKGGKIARSRAIAATAKGVAWITAPSVALWFINKDEEWYQDRHTWERGAFWMMSPDHGDTIIRIPKSFELGYVFGSIPEMILQQLYESDPEFAKDVVWDTIKSFMPIGGSTELVPQVLRPYVEAETNYRTFPKPGPIVSPFVEASRIPADQYTRYTTESAKVIGEELGVSPAKVEHVIGGYTGGLGLDAIRVLDNLSALGQDKAAQEMTGFREASDIPIVGTLFARKGMSRALDDLYQREKVLRQREGSEVITDSEREELSITRTYLSVIGEISDAADNGVISQREAQDRIVDTAREARDIIKQNKGVE